MKLIRPSEISGRILSLLDESESLVILVSPYMKISKWYKITNKIKSLEARKIHAEIYVRDDPENETTYRDLDLIGLQYKKIPYLHSKLYLNERYGIVTSMNLLLSSEINSLEIAYATETWEEYNDLLGYFYRHLFNGEALKRAESVGKVAVAQKEISHCIRKALGRKGKNSWLWLAENVLHICTGRNNYTVSINDGYLRIIASLGKSIETKQKSSRKISAIKKKLRDLTAMKVLVYPNCEPGILRLSGQAQYKLESSCIDVILESETAYIVEAVIRFIVVAEDLI